MSSLPLPFNCYLVLCDSIIFFFYFVLFRKFTLIYIRLQPRIHKFLDLSEFVIGNLFLQLNWFSTSLSVWGVVSFVFVKLILLNYFSGYGFCISPIPVINLIFVSPLGFIIFFKLVKGPSFSVLLLRIFLENVCDMWTSNFTPSRDSS